MRDLPDDIHPTQDEAGQDQDLFTPVSRRVRASAAMGFLTWQRDMRGALSQLPTASGPWIWQPTDAAQRPAQMDFLEGLQT